MCIVMTTNSGNHAHNRHSNMVRIIQLQTCGDKIIWMYSIMQTRPIAHTLGIWAGLHYGAPDCIIYVEGLEEIGRMCKS